MIKQVIIGFSSPSRVKIGAEIIKLWMRTPYSHVFLLLHSNYTGLDLVYQASHGSVNCLTLDNFKKDNRIVDQFSILVEEEQLKNCLVAAQQLLGRPYGYLGLIRLALSKLGIPMVGDGLSTLHCSEFIGRLFPNLINKSADLVEPVDLYRALEVKHV